MVCPNKFEEVVNKIEDHDPLIRAMVEAENIKRRDASVRNAQRTGRYSTAKTRVFYGIDYASKLVGTTIGLEEFDTAKFVDVYVKSAEMISDGIVSVNNGQYVLDVKNGQTRDGKYTMGSEEEAFKGDIIKLAELTGTVLNDLEDLTEDMIETDGEVLSAGHAEHIRNVMKKYMDVLKEAGKDVEFNIETYQALDARENTRGEADPEKGRLKLILGNQKNNTLSEILAHEMQHILLREVIGKDKHLEYNILRMREALKNHFNKMYKNEGWKVFTEGRENADVNDAKLKYEYVFNNPKFGADEFLAYTTTNEQLVKQLGIVTNLQQGRLFQEVNETGKWTKLVNKVIRLLNAAYNSRMNNGRTAKELALGLLDEALVKGHNRSKLQSKSMMSEVINKITAVDKKIAKYTGKIEKEYKTYDEYLRSQQDDKLKAAMDKIWKIRGLAKVRSGMLQNNLFNSVTRDFSNPEVARFYEMFRKSKAFIDKEVVDVKSKTAHVLDDVYGFKLLEPKVKGALKRVLMDIDATAIGDIDEIKKYLSNPKELERYLDNVTSKYDGNVVFAMSELADLILTNKMSIRNGYTNAAQIAFIELKTRDRSVIKEIDKIVSMIALSRLDEESRTNALDGFEKNPDGIAKAMVLKKANEEEVLDKAYFGDEMYQIKGAKQEVYKSEKRHYLVNAKEMKELVKSGMVNIGKNSELSRIMGEDIYTVIGDSIDPVYTEGLMSTIQLKNEGDSLKRLLVERGMTEEEASAKIDELATEVGLSTEQSGSLIPERSGNGEIYDYRFRIPYEDKSNYMDLDDNIVVTLASTISNLTHKQEAMVNNKASIIYMSNFYNSYKHSNKYKFIEISERSEGKYKEYWDRIPFYLKRELKRLSDGKLMIEESMLVDFFGYQDVSLVNAPWIKDKVKRQIIVKKLEKVVMELTKAWKQAIVAYTPATIRGNMLSNMIVALQHTQDKNPMSYIQKFHDMWQRMDEYQADRAKMLELEIRQKSGEKVNTNEINRLKAKMKANPVSLIIEDGQFNSLLSDIDNGYFDKKGILENKLNKAMEIIKKDKSRQNLKSFVDLLYIKKDSRIHDSVMKLTIYSDAINKMIILSDIMDKNNGQVTQKDLNYMDQLHVNYGYLDNKFVKYMNDLGFLVFTKYMFRVFPAMLKMLSNKAFSVMLTEGTIKFSGIGETPFKQFYNPVDSLARKASMWSDPMAFAQDLVVPHIIPH